MNSTASEDSRSIGSEAPASPKPWTTSATAVAGGLVVIVVVIVVTLILTLASASNAAQSAREDGAPHEAAATRLRSFNWCGPEPVMALTFDGGPSPGVTETLLQQLRSLDLVASFFLAPGQQEEPQQAAAQCALIQAMLRDGHEVHCRSFDGASLQGKTLEQVASQLAQWRAWALPCAGPYASRLSSALQFRPPHAALNHTQAMQVVGLGFTIATWTVDSTDWRGGNVTDIVEAVEVGAGALPPNSSIVLLFDERAAVQAPVAAALAEVVARFRRRGYRFMTSTACYGLCGKAVCALPGLWPGVYDDDDDHDARQQ